MDNLLAARQQMVVRQIEERGVREPRLLAALRQVPRHLFLPSSERASAYSDQALPIDCGQTISQPYVVACMIQALELQGDETVLEVGTGSGYQAAVLSLLCRQVISLEYIKKLADQSASLLSELHYHNVTVYHSDGSTGWPSGAPYQAMIVSAAAPAVPRPLLDQLADGGRLIIPVGSYTLQELQLWQRRGNELIHHDVLPVVFVPLRGSLGWQDTTE